MHDTRAPFVDPCYRSRPVTGRNGQGFTTLPPSGPQEGCLGPTNSPTTNRVINYSIREANFLLLTFTPMLSDQPRGRCEESLVDSCCLPSYEKQESCFSSVQASTVLRSSRIVVRPLLCRRRHKIAIFYHIYEGQSLDNHALCNLSVWSATPFLRQSAHSRQCSDAYNYTRVVTLRTSLLLYLLYVIRLPIPMSLLQLLSMLQLCRHSMHCWRFFSTVSLHRHCKALQERERKQRMPHEIILSDFKL